MVISSIDELIMALVVFLVAFVTVVAWLWALFALRYFGPVRPSVRLPLLAVLLAGPWIVLAAGGWLAASIATGILVLPIVLGWIVVEPRNDLDWAADQERLPRVQFNGDEVTIHNLRRATYRSPTDFDVEWFSQTFDLSRVRTVEYVVEPFGKWAAMAHTFVTFGFEGGEYLPISIEVRRERPEKFNPVAGIFRQYELMYVMGDERDLIGLRANIRKDAVYVYPIRASRERVRQMLEAMLRRAAELYDNPEFYNTLINNCATNILRHLNQIQGRRFPINYQVIAPGLSDRYALEHGLIDTDLSLEAARDRFRINERSAFNGKDSVEWSAQIRDLNKIGEPTLRTEQQASAE